MIPPKEIMGKPEQVIKYYNKELTYEDIIINIEN